MFDLMQARALGCVVIVAVMRLLNLAVPILYRDVVNTLADVSSKTHPPPGQAPQRFTFKQASQSIAGALTCLAWSHWDCRGGVIICMQLVLSASWVTPFTMSVLLEGLGRGFTPFAHLA